VVDPFSLLGQATVGWLLADLLGGLFHWWEDRVAYPRWAWLDTYVWAPNRRHHAEPMAFTHTDLWSRNLVPALLAIAVAGLWVILRGPSVVLLFATLGGILQNEVHCWAHQRQTGIIGVLQRIGILQSTAEHARHHKPPETVNYCVLTNWCNPVLEHLKVWQRLERFLHLGLTAE
jgi:hypothetical protein